MENLFSYGTLREENVQRAIFGRTVQGAADAIAGFRLATVRISNRDSAALSGRDVHTIMERTEDTDAVVEGVVLQITAKELELADAYESAEYTRVRVRLRSGADTWVYAKV